MRDDDTGPAGDGTDATPPGQFRRTLVRVMVMQVIALALLWFLQEGFGR